MSKGYRLTLGLLVSLHPVLGKTVPVEDLVASSGHVAEQGTIEGVVVTVVKVIIGSSEGRVRLEFVVGGKTSLGTTTKSSGS